MKTKIKFNSYGNIFNVSTALSEILSEMITSRKWMKFDFESRLGRRYKLINTKNIITVVKDGEHIFYLDKSEMNINSASDIQKCFEFQARILEQLNLN